MLDEIMNGGSHTADAAHHGDTAVVTLTIPCAPEYVGTARLTLLGVASRMGFSYDQVEDIRLAVGEACANAIERAHRGAVSEPQIQISCQVDAAKLTIEVEDQFGVGGAASASDENAGLDGERTASEIDGMNSQELGALLMEILVDEVQVEAAPSGGTRVRLVKHAQPAVVEG